MEQIAARFEIVAPDADRHELRIRSDGLDLAARAENVLGRGASTRDVHEMEMESVRKELRVSAERSRAHDIARAGAQGRDTRAGRERVTERHILVPGAQHDALPGGN